MTPFHLFKKKETSGLTPEEENVYDLLRRNRDTLVNELPEKVRHELLDTVYSDKELRDIVLSTFREPGVAGNRSGWLADCLAARFGDRDFGARLVTQFRVNPDDVLRAMLKDCHVDAAPPDTD